MLIASEHSHQRAVWNHSVARAAVSQESRLQRLKEAGPPVGKLAESLGGSIALRVLLPFCRFYLEDAP